MQALLDVILPVFFVIGFGYVAVRMGWFTQAGVDGVMTFTQRFAIPCLLFVAMARLDLSQNFDWRLLLTYYSGALTCFLLGLFGARILFGRDWEDAVVIGFVCLFSNTVLLGLPLTERAYGVDALEANFAIIAIHSPLCYGIGIALMEVIRARGEPGAAIVPRVFKAMFSNTLILGVGSGLLVNLSGVPIPQVLSDGLDMMVRAALPATLFGMGGVLAGYRIDGDLRTVGYICMISLLIQPAITRSLGLMLDLSDAATRSAVLTAAVAPGVNGYIFANMYGRAKRVAATSVLVATVITIFSASVWLSYLP